MATPNQSVSRNGFWRVLDERLGLSGLAYPVPAYSNTLPYIRRDHTLWIYHPDRNRTPPGAVLPSSPGGRA